MPVPPDAIALLEGLAEPSFLLAPGGAIEHMNRAAAELASGERSGKGLIELHGGDRASMAAFLKRCEGSRQPLVGSCTLEAGGSGQRFQCRGNAVQLGDRRLVLLRLSRADETRFASLTKMVADLNRELRERRRTQALLEESLREREVLLRELQHRVKNNMQMLAAMLHLAKRESPSPEVKAALGDASRRFGAASAVQQLLYASADVAHVNSRELVSKLLHASLSLAGDGFETEIETESFDLGIEVAVPLGLILNELLTNSLKHGRPPTGPLKLSVGLKRNGSMLHLAVADNGPGFDLRESSKRASGLGLVRALLRKLGGSLTVEKASGARSMITVPLGPADR